MWLDEMNDLASKMKETRTNTDSGIWLKSRLRSRVSFGSRVESKSKNWDSYYFPIIGMWFFKIGGSVLKSMGTGINVGSKNASKLGKDTGVNMKLHLEGGWIGV